VGVTAPTVYRYFDDREALVDAVVQDAFERYLQAKRDKPRTGDVVEDIRAGWDLHLEFGMQHPVLYELMFPTLDVNRFHPAATTSYHTLKGAFERAAAEGRLRGGLTSDDAARALTAAVFGVTRMLSADPRNRSAINAVIRDGVLGALLTERTEQEH
jgi:AcrR family transcriptional regulator